MSKHYRVLKDTPTWAKGAVLVEKTSGNYSAVSDLWDQVESEPGREWIECSAIVTQSPEFFERVYETSILGKVSYMTKEKAREVADKMFSGRKKPEAKQ